MSGHSQVVGVFCEKRLRSRFPEKRLRQPLETLVEAKIVESFGTPAMGTMLIGYWEIGQLNVRTLAHLRGRRRVRVAET